MNHCLQGLDARSASRDVALVCGVTQQLLEEPLGPLRQLRLHCLRERLHLLLEALEGADHPAPVANAD
jgi:hypothetical protein